MSMVITLTDSALRKLRKMEWQTGTYPRIDAHMVGGCGLSVSLKLVFDEPRKNDIVFEYEGIRITMDRFTKRNLDEQTQIDYSDELGFIIGETFVSGACAIEVLS